MKTDQQVKTIITIVFLVSLIGLLVSTQNYFNRTTELKNDKALAVNLSKDDISLKNQNNDDNENNTENENTVEDKKEIVFEGMTMDELAEKLNRSLNSTLSGYGYQFASKSLELGLDPYLAVAIVLHETGCSWGCSELVNQCYNVGGQKGAPGCWGGEYQAFGSMEEGINAYLENLYYNYVAQGLTSPEAINTRYASSQTWASKIYYYIDLIRAA